jgi:Pyruvate phosphate dikinase, AMP/ATP-binding domain
MTLVLWLHDPDGGSAELVGGKFASLAELAGAGFGVPPAFAVCTEAYHAFMREAGLADAARAAREAAAGGDLTTVEAEAERMRAAIERAPLPGAVAEAVAGAYARLCEQAGAENVSVAVRRGRRPADRDRVRPAAPRFRRAGLGAGALPGRPADERADLESSGGGRPGGAARGGGRRARGALLDQPRHGAAHVSQ